MRIYFHKREMFHCWNRDTIFVGERQLLFTLRATIEINTRDVTDNIAAITPFSELGHYWLRNNLSAVLSQSIAWTNAHKSWMSC